MAKILEGSFLVGENEEFSFGHAKFKMSVGFSSQNAQSSLDVEICNSEEGAS